MNLIEVKNNVPRYSMQLNPVTNRYHPEDPDYMEGIIYMVFVVMFTGALIFLAFFIFLICRLGFKKCGGNSTKEDENEEFNPSRRTNFVVGVVLLTIMLIGTSIITLIGDIGYFNSALKSSS